MFLKIVEDFPINYTDDDQLWLTKVFLSGKYALQLDYDQNLFSSMAFEADDDYTYDTTQITNNKTLTKCKFLHYNGRTDSIKGDKVLKNILQNGL